MPRFGPPPRPSRRADVSCFPASDPISNPPTTQRRLNSRPARWPCLSPCPRASMTDTTPLLRSSETTAPFDIARVQIEQFHLERAMGKPNSSPANSYGYRRRKSNSRDRRPANRLASPTRAVRSALKYSLALRRRRPQVRILSGAPLLFYRTDLTSLFPGRPEQKRELCDDGRSER